MEDWKYEVVAETRVVFRWREGGNRMTRFICDTFGSHAANTTGAEEAQQIAAALNATLEPPPHA